MHVDTLKERARYFRWRWLRNFPDSASYVLQTKTLNDSCSSIVKQLRRHGIIDTPYFLDNQLFCELRAQALTLLEKVWDEKKGKPRPLALDRKGDRSAMGPEEQKDFLQVLTPKSFDLNSVYLRFTLQPELIAIASAYLGLSARLRAVHLWLNYATEDAPASTQLWHRDGDDFMNLKVFTYLTDVDSYHGPFAYVPGTQPLGFRKMRPASSGFGRTTDGEMRAVAPETNWKICTGPTGTMIFADTCGYHKGVKPLAGYRLMLMAHYVSSRAVSESEIDVDLSDAGSLSLEQLRAVGLAR